MLRTTPRSNPRNDDGGPARNNGSRARNISRAVARSGWAAARNIAHRDPAVLVVMVVVLAVALIKGAPLLAGIALVYFVVSATRSKVIESSRSTVPVIRFTVDTRHASYSNLDVEVVDPDNSQQLEAGARAALKQKGLDPKDLISYRAYRTDGVPLGPKVTV